MQIQEVEEVQIVRLVDLQYNLVLLRVNRVVLFAFG
jgi:hypothetical protein